MGVKKVDRGKVLARIGHYHIRQILEKDRTGKVTGTNICIFHAKTKIKEGFKNTQQALEYASALLKEKAKS